MLRCLATALALVALLASGVIAAEYVPGEILIRYKPGLAIQAASAVTDIGGTQIRSLDQIRLRRIKLPPGMSVEAAIARVKRNPNVEYAGPNHIIRICLEPDDPYYNTGWLDVFTQWGLYSPDYPDAGIEAREAWSEEIGSDTVIIAIVDTGVYTAHEDLWDKIVPGQNTIAGADPNDYEDDSTMGHGTFVAGIAGAMTDNGVGIAGVSWGSKIMPIKTIGADGVGTEEDAAAGIIWAAANGAKVINMSFAGIDVPAEQAAIEYAWTMGCVLVAASGNEDTSAPSYPAAYEHVIAVGATNEYIERCGPDDWGPGGGSNYGDHLDVMAPGNGILSTTNPLAALWDDYTISQGTSAAAPFVSGIAALVCSHYPAWTNAQVVEQIESTCRDMSPSGWDQYTGWGLVSAYHAVVDSPAGSTKLGDIANIGSGTIVTIDNAVLTSGSVDFPNRLYIESTDRVAGAVLPFTNTPPQLIEGDIVRVRGTVMFLDGERGLQGATVTKTGHQNPIQPLGIANRNAGGARLNLKSGVTGGVGLNNLGLLVTVVGRVTAYPGWTYFYIDDGSRNFDGSGFEGLKVICGSLLKPQRDSFVRITGLSSCERPTGAGVTIPAIRVRRQSDIVVVQ